MRKYAGAGCLVLGIMLSGLGLDSAEPMHSQISRLFAGWTAGGPMLIAGVLSVGVGLYLWRFSGKVATKEK